MKLDHIRNNKLFKDGMDFTKHVMIPLSGELRNQIDILPISTQTAYSERHGHLLLVPFLLESEELTEAERVHYEELTKKGWATVIVVQGTPPASVSAIWVFDLEGDWGRREADTDYLQMRVLRWWLMADSASCPPLLGGPTRVVRILGEGEHPQREKPEVDWDFPLLFGGHLGGMVRATDVDGGCISGGHLLLIEEKQARNDLNAASRIAFEKLSKNLGFTGIAVFGPSQRMERYDLLEFTWRVRYTLDDLREWVRHAALSAVKRLWMLNWGPLRERVKVGAGVRHEIIRATDPGKKSEG